MEYREWACNLESSNDITWKTKEKTTLQQSWWTSHSTNSLTIQTVIVSVFIFLFKIPWNLVKWNSFHTAYLYMRHAIYEFICLLGHSYKFRHWEIVIILRSMANFTYLGWLILLKSGKPQKYRDICTYICTKSKHVLKNTIRNSARIHILRCTIDRQH